MDVKNKNRKPYFINLNWSIIQISHRIFDLSSYDFLEFLFNVPFYLSDCSEKKTHELP